VAEGAVYYVAARKQRVRERERDREREREKTKHILHYFLQLGTTS
jgi:hypothetical protein